MGMTTAMTLYNLSRQHNPPQPAICLRSMALARTFRADALYHIIYRKRFKAIGQFHLRHSYTLKTQRLLALLTVEMGMLVVICILTLAAAELITHTVSAIL